MVFPSFVIQCLTHTEKAYKLAVIQRATDTGAITYQLFTLSPFGRRGLCGARCGLLSPRDLSPDTHRLSYFYVLQVHVIGYGCRSVLFSVQVELVFLPLFLNCDAKVQTIFETCKRFTENLYIFNIASLYSIYIKDLDTYFRHKLTKMCNI